MPGPQGSIKRVRKGQRLRNLWRAGLLFAGIVMLAQPTFGKKEPKTYPEEGKVTGVGTTEHGNRIKSHIYKVETATRLLVLDCGTRFGFSGGECGGDKKLQVGDVIHFRREKDLVFIPASQTLRDSDGVSHREPDEQKLRVVSEELKPDEKSRQSQ
jgi:hypothetical protein